MWQGMQPKTKALLVALVSAVAAAVVAWLQACTPAQLDKADSALSAADEARAVAGCLRDVAEQYGDAELSESNAREALAALKACKPSEQSADAGSK
jgi:hypothetical protein